MDEFKQKLIDHYQDKTYTQISKRLYELFNHIDREPEIYQPDMEILDEEIEYLIELLNNYPL